MTYASPFLDPSLDKPAARPAVLNTNQRGRPFIETTGATSLNSNRRAVLPAPPRPSCSMGRDNDCTPYSYGFSTEFRREQPWLRESVGFMLFAVVACALPGVTAALVIRLFQ